MPVVSDSRVLLAPRHDVWAFLAEPYHLPDWWPDIAGVEPDRRGVAPGARWRIQGHDRPSLLRKPSTSGTLQVLRVHPLELLAFQLTADRIDVEVRLESSEENRTRVTVVIEGPWLVGLRRTLPRKALARLHALCQTSAGL